MITKDKVTKRQAEHAKAAIKAGQITKRLQSYVLGEPAIETCECGKEYEVFNISRDELKKMEPAKVRAGLVSLILNVCFPAKADIRGTHEVVIWRLLIYLMNLKCARFGASL